MRNAIPIPAPAPARKRSTGSHQIRTRTRCRASIARSPSASIADGETLGRTKPRYHPEASAGFLLLSQ